MHDVWIGATALRKKQTMIPVILEVFFVHRLSNTYWSSVNEELDDGIQPLRAEFSICISWQSIPHGCSCGNFGVKTRLLKRYQHLQRQLEGIKARWGTRAKHCSGGGHSPFNPTTTEFTIFLFPPHCEEVEIPILWIIRQELPGGFFLCCLQNWEITKGFF